jgi:hypothetical protein
MKLIKICEVDPNNHINNKKNIIKFKKNKTNNDCDITPLLFLLNLSTQVYLSYTKWHNHNNKNPCEIIARHRQPKWYNNPS